MACGEIRRAFSCVGPASKGKRPITSGRKRIERVRQDDMLLNQSPGPGACKLSTADSRVGVWLIPTDEEAVIARDTWALSR